MPNLDIYLYANGALRLTRHGKGRGGNVLVYDHDGKIDQCEIADDWIEPLCFNLAQMDEKSSSTSLALPEVFANIAAFIAIPGTTRLAA